MDRRLFRKQIQKVEEEMEQVKVQREVYRQKRRERDNLPIGSNPTPKPRHLNPETQLNMTPRRDAN